MDTQLYTRYPYRTSSSQNWWRLDPNLEGEESTSCEFSYPLDIEGIGDRGHVARASNDNITRRHRRGGSESSSTTNLNLGRALAKSIGHADNYQLRAGNSDSMTFRSQLKRDRSNRDSLFSRFSSGEAKSDINSDQEIEAAIQSILLNPLTKTSEEFRGPNGRPLGVEVAINAYLRGEYSTGDLRREYRPKSLAIPQMKLPRWIEDETIVGGSAGPLSQNDSTAKTLSVNSQEGSHFGYDDPEDWYRSSVSEASQSLEVYRTSGPLEEHPPSTNVSVERSQLVSSPMPVPDKVPFSRSLCSLRVAAPPKSSHTRFHSTDASPSAFPSKDGFKPHILQGPTRSVPPSHVPCWPFYSESQLFDYDHPTDQSHIHPALRRPNQPSPLRLSRSNEEKSQALPPGLSPSNDHEVSPISTTLTPLSPTFDRPSPPSSFLGLSFDASDRPSMTISDPLPDLTEEDISGKFADRFKRESLETGPGTPWTRVNYLTQRRPSPERLMEYARAIEDLNGLLRIRGADEKAVAISDKQSLLDTNLPLLISTTRESDDAKTFPMKKRPSNLKRVDFDEALDADRCESAMGKRMLMKENGRQIARRSSTSNYLEDRTRAVAATVDRPSTSLSTYRKGVKDFVKGVDKEHARLITDLLDGTSIRASAKKKKESIKKVCTAHSISP